MMSPTEIHNPNGRPSPRKGTFCPNHPVMRVGTAMMAAHPANFFMTVLSLASWMDRLVSKIVATRSRRESDHSETRMEWSYRSLKYGSRTRGTATASLLGRLIVETISRIGSTTRRNCTNSLRSRYTRNCTFWVSIESSKS